MELSNRSTRVPLGILTVTLLVAAVVLVTGPSALGSHIPPTGPLPGNCVNFQAGSTGSASPADYSGVTITLDSWDSTPGDPHEVTFTIGGLGAGQYVDISVKSGTTVQEVGPYGNGTHTYSNGLQNAISHIRLCVFEDPVESTTTTVEETTTTTVAETTTTVAETTTTVAETTTTVAETTTTVAETTTTVPEETTTTVADTTTTIFPPEVLPTVVTTSTTVEVEGTEVLPFTGSESGGTAAIALVLVGVGALVLAAAKESRSSSDL